MMVDKAALLLSAGEGSPHGILCHTVPVKGVTDLRLLSMLSVEALLSACTAKLTINAKQAVHVYNVTKTVCQTLCTLHSDSHGYSHD